MVILTLAAAALTTACAPMYMMSPPRKPLMSSAPARENPVGRWDAVMSLDSRAIVGVLSADGIAHTGRVARVGMHWLRLIENGAEIEIPRADVARVDLLSDGGNDTAARVAAGAGLGALIAAGTEMFFAAGYGGRVRVPWRTAALGAAGGAVGGAVDASARRAQRTIYVSPDLVR
jgi:hypothetical protein